MPGGVRYARREKRNVKEIVVFSTQFWKIRPRA